MTGRPLRIAMISYYLPSGSKQGIGYQVHELAGELARRGHSVDVFSECPPVPGSSYGHHRIELSGPLRTFRFATALRRIDFSGYDVVHAHGDDYWMWRRRAPVHVRTLHGSCFEEARRIRGVKERTRMILLGFSEVLASLVADVTVAVSPDTRKWTPWVHRVIPNGVDARRFRPRGQEKADHPVILFVGSWKGRKRGAQLAEIFARTVRPQVPGAELWMVSEDVPEDVAEGVIGLGRLSNAELVEAYHRAWVFCLPSSYEGFGIPYVEAMAAGLPVVTTPNVGADFVTEHGRYGRCVELDGLGPALVGLLDSPERRRRLGRAGLVRAREFSLDTVVSAYERIYRGGREAR